MIKKVLIGIGILALLLISAFFFSIQSNQNQPPPELVANFVDLDKINKISKFRSCAGHVTVPQDNRETKRNMKHYFDVKAEFVGTDQIKIYAPYDGYVSSIRSDPSGGLEGEIWLTPKRAFPILLPFGVWEFSVQHIIVRSDLKMGSEVKAGEVIGRAGAPDVKHPNIDFLYAKMAFPPTPKRIDNWNSPFGDLDSIFNHMSDDVFAQFEKRGITRENIILSKEERDQNPCTYRDQGPYFENSEDPSNWIPLN